MFAFILESIGTAELLLIFFVGFIIIGLILFLLTKSAKTNLRKCPFCAEMIQPEAIVCRFCGRNLNGR